MEEKKNNKGLVWLIVVLIILVLGLIGYIVYDKVLSTEKEHINNESTSTTTTTSSINEKEELNYIITNTFSNFNFRCCNS